MAGPLALSIWESIVVVMAIPLSGFVKWLSIVFLLSFGRGIATAGQGSIVPF